MSLLSSVVAFRTIKGQETSSTTPTFISNYHHHHLPRSFSSPKIIRFSNISNVNMSSPITIIWWQLNVIAEMLRCRICIYVTATLPREPKTHVILPNYFSHAIVQHLKHLQSSIDKTCFCCCQCMPVTKVSNRYGEVQVLT